MFRPSQNRGVQDILAQPELTGHFLGDGHLVAKSLPNAAQLQKESPRLRSIQGIGPQKIRQKFQEWIYLLPGQFVVTIFRQPGLRIGTGETLGRNSQ
jgi:hypothetical protein